MLSIIDDSVGDKILDTKTLSEVARQNGVVVNVVESDNIDPFGNRINPLGEMVFNKYVNMHQSKLRASPSYIGDRIMMNSAIFLKPGTGSKYYQQLMLSNSLLSEHCISTNLIDSRDDVQRLLDSKDIQLPIVIKPEQGAESVDVKIIKQKTDLAKIKRFRASVVQPYIKHDIEWRVYVIGGVVLPAIACSHVVDDVSRGVERRIESIETCEEVTKTLNRLSLQCVSILGLEYSGVDIMQDKDTGKFHIIEANVSAAITMSAYKRLSGENIAQEVIDWFLERDKLVHQKMPLEQCLSDYLMARIKRLTPETRESVDAILANKEKMSGKLTESQIEKDFFSIPLENKLEYLYDGLREGENVKLAEVILGEAEQSVSWAGNFLVDVRSETNTGVSGAHTLENGAVASAYYIASKRLLAK